MRLLGIDFGTKRVGIALSDESAILAFPEAVLDNDNLLLENILKIIKEKEIGKIIIGESKDYKMKDNLIMEDINNFIESLKKETNIPIKLHPEFMSSMQAEKEMGQKTKSIDAQAATIILQSYIDLKK